MNLLYHRGQLTSSLTYSFPYIIVILLYVIKATRYKVPNDLLSSISQSWGR